MIFTFADEQFKRGKETNAANYSYVFQCRPLTQVGSITLDKELSSQSNSRLVRYSSHRQTNNGNCSLFVYLRNNW